jgi:hypothetical protein
MKQIQSQFTARPNRATWKLARLILLVATLLVTTFVSATSTFGQGLEGRVEPASSTAVIFPTNRKAQITLLNQTELTAKVPSRTTSGDVYVSTQTGTSNNVPFELGSSFVPSETGEASTWDSTFSGVLGSNTVWNSNLLLTGDVTVPAGVTLTIDSGTTIFVSSDNDDQNGGLWSDKTELIVFGTLLVNGSETAPVYFTSDAAEKAPGNWGGIQIREGSTTSELSNCMVRYAKEGVRIASINVPGGGDVWARVQNCSIQYNEIGISIWANTHWPSGTHVNVGAEITNNLIANNVKEGIYLWNWCGFQSTFTDPTIRNNLIENNGTGIYLRSGSWWLGHIDDRTTVINNSIKNNETHGILIEATGSGDASGSDTDAKPMVENNLLTGNHTNIYLLFDPKGSDGLQDLQPTIRYNTIKDAPFGIVLSDTQPYDTLIPAIDHNVFEGFDGVSSYAISNETDRTVHVESNYWGSTPAEWDAGMPASFVIGPVVSLSHLDSSSPPIITRFAPEVGQPGSTITVYGANFGSKRR